MAVVNRDGDAMRTLGAAARLNDSPAVSGDACIMAVRPSSMTRLSKIFFIIYGVWFVCEGVANLAILTILANLGQRETQLLPASMPQAASMSRPRLVRMVLRMPLELR